MRARSPIFIIGTERSGSNLLRLILDQHSRITMPHPPHFVRFLAPLAPSYGDLRVEARRRALVRDALRLLSTHIHPWEHAIDEDRATASASPTLFGVVAAIYEQYRIASGKARWGCKSTFMVRHVNEVLAEYPEARFVWLYRDPRDVAVSSRRSVFSTCHPQLTAELWRADQEHAERALERLGPAQVHALRYEDLVTDAEREIRRLCVFLEEPFEAAMLEFHRSDAAQKSAALSESWRNTGKPITRQSVGSHSNALTIAEQMQVEAIAGEVMQRLGYPLLHPRSELASALSSAATVRALELFYRAKVEYRSLWHDHNHWRRWARDGTVRALQVKALLQKAVRSMPPSTA